MQVQQGSAPCSKLKGWRESWVHQAVQFWAPGPVQGDEVRLSYRQAGEGTSLLPRRQGWHSATYLPSGGARASGSAPRVLPNPNVGNLWICNQVQPEVWSWLTCSFWFEEFLSAWHAEEQEPPQFLIWSSDRIRFHLFQYLLARSSTRFFSRNPFLKNKVPDTQTTEDQHLFLGSPTLVLLEAARFCSSNTLTSPWLSPTSRQSVFLAKRTDVNFPSGLPEWVIIGSRLQHRKGRYWWWYR